MVWPSWCAPYEAWVWRNEGLWPYHVSVSYRNVWPGSDVRATKCARPHTGQAQRRDTPRLSWQVLLWGFDSSAQEWVEADPQGKTSRYLEKGWKGAHLYAFCFFGGQYKVPHSWYYTVIVTHTPKGEEHDFCDVGLDITTADPDLHPDTQEILPDEDPNASNAVYMVVRIIVNTPPLYRSFPIIMPLLEHRNSLWCYWRGRIFLPAALSFQSSSSSHCRTLGEEPSARCADCVWQ